MPDKCVTLDVLYIKRPLKQGKLQISKKKQIHLPINKRQNSLLYLNKQE